MDANRTDDQEPSPPQRRPEGGERHAVSYLVRFWIEPADGEASPLRGYCRDLKSGEEHFFTDPRRFAEHVLRRLQQRRASRPAELFPARASAPRRRAAP